MSRRKSERRKRMNELTEQEERMEETREKIVKLKQIKTSSKALFTRTKHKLTALMEKESLDTEKLKELRNELSKQQQKIVELLSELSIEYGNVNDVQKQDKSLDEIEKVNEDFNNVMTEAKELFQSIRSERMTVSNNSQRSLAYTISSQTKERKAELRRKEKEAELRQRKKKLDELYQKEKSKIDEQMRQNESPLRNTSNNNSENLELDPDEDDEARSVEPNYNDKVTDWVKKSHENLMKGDILNESHLKEKIGQDLWKQLRRVSIPVFNGDNWKSAFMACVDKAPATPEYKLLQLRQYLSGEALKSIETLGHSGYEYEAAKERLERKFGGERRKLMLFMDELENFKPVRDDHPKDIEKFADLLDIP